MPKGVYPRPSLEARFWAKVEQGPSPDDCWRWNASTDSHGYGIIGFKDGPSGYIRASRASWIIHFGTPPEGMDICHACDNPPCTNPKHLFLGDARANMADASRKGRIPLGAQRPSSKLTDQSVIEIRRLAEDGMQLILIASLFGVDKSVISRIVRREAWKHVP